jgi:hypothetical protein
LDKGWAVVQPYPESDQPTQQTESLGIGIAHLGDIEYQVPGLNAGQLRRALFREELDPTFHYLPLNYQYHAIA